MKARYAGDGRIVRYGATLSPRPENNAVKYLRQLRSYVAGTPDMRPRDLLDKIDDLLLQARGGK